MHKYHYISDFNLIDVLVNIKTSILEICVVYKQVDNKFIFMQLYPTLPDITLTMSLSIIEEILKQSQAVTEHEARFFCIVPAEIYAAGFGVDKVFEFCEVIIDKPNSCVEFRHTICPDFIKNAFQIYFRIFKRQTYFLINSGNDNKIYQWED